MAKNYHDITLALAGICQSAQLVQQLAHQGRCDPATLLISYTSIIDLNPANTLSIFGNQYSNLRAGLETLTSLLNIASRQTINQEIMRYVLNMIILERKLNASKAAINNLTDRITGLQRQLEHFPLDSDTLINAMAAIYLDIISPLGQRIQVTGTVEILQSPLVQAKVRATLLAGIRAAVLWRQVGGGRLQLMLARNKLLTQTKQILVHC